MTENVFQNPEWWKQNVKKGDWVKLSIIASSYYNKSYGTCDVVEYEELELRQGRWFMHTMDRDFHMSGNWGYDLDMIDEVLEIRRRGNVISMVETVLPVGKVKE